MNCHATLLLYFSYGLLCATATANSAAPITNTPKANPSVATSFVKGIELSAREVQQVITLAGKCGIRDIAKIETFHYLPVGGKGASVTSIERVEERNVSYDMLGVNRNGWSSLRPSRNVKRVGAFWAEPLEKYTTMMRVYDVKKEKVRVIIGEGVDVQFADKVMASISARKVREENPPRSDNSALAKPHAIYRDSGGEYRLMVNESRGFSFKMEKDEVLVTGIIHIMI